MTGKIVEKEDNIRISIGNRISEIREKKRMTQSELSQKTGLEQANISRIEKGKYGVSIDLLTRILDGLDCHLEIIENEKVAEPAEVSFNCNKALLDNAFIIKRLATKRSKNFICNVIERPITAVDLFWLLRLSDLKLNYWDMQSVFVGNKFINNYRSAIPSDSPILHITSNSASIKHLYQHGEYISVRLNRDELLKTFKFLDDNTLYTTDFEVDRVYHYRIFYQKK